MFRQNGSKILHCKSDISKIAIAPSQNVLSKEGRQVVVQQRKSQGALPRRQDQEKAGSEIWGAVSGQAA